MATLNVDTPVSTPTIVSERFLPSAGSTIVTVHISAGPAGAVVWRPFSIDPRTSKRASLDSEQTVAAGTAAVMSYEGAFSAVDLDLRAPGADTTATISFTEGGHR